MRARQRHIAADGIDAFRLVVAGEAGEQRHARPGRLGAAQILARQRAAAERRIGQQPAILAQRHFGQTLLERPVYQTIGVLNAGDARQAPMLGQGQKTHGAPGRLVREADRADLALLDQFGQRVERRLDRDLVRIQVMGIGRLAEGDRVPVGPMQLIKVDAVGAEPFQAVLDRRTDIGTVEPGAAVADMLHVARGADDLGRQHQLVAQAGRLQPAADIALGQALGLGLGRHRIHLGRVDEIDAAIIGQAQLLMRLGFGVLFAECHGAEADAADFDIGSSEAAIVHGGTRGWG